MVDNSTQRTQEQQLVDLFGLFRESLGFGEGTIESFTVNTEHEDIEVDGKPLGAKATTSQIKEFVIDSPENQRTMYVAIGRWDGRDDVRDMITNNA